MTMASIRKSYGVPARRGGRIRFQGKEGQIVAARGAYLRVSFNGAAQTLHPTWEVEYLPTPQHRGSPNAD